MFPRVPETLPSGRNLGQHIADQGVHGHDARSPRLGLLHGQRPREKVDAPPRQLALFAPAQAGIQADEEERAMFDEASTQKRSFLPGLTV
jgi:hypothetical protein